MRARHRHFNPRFAGADLVLDARYINQSDNTEVASWNDRSNNAYTIDQTVSANRPTLRTNQLNGNAVVRFDGTSDFLNGGNILNLGTNGLIMLCVGKIAAGTTAAFCGKSRASNTSGRYALYREVGVLTALYARADSGINATLSSDTSTDYRIIAQRIQRTAENKLFVNGAERAASASLTAGDTTNHNTSDQFFVGAYQSSSGTTPAQAFLNGDIASVIVLISSAQSSSVQKRLEHAAAYSFKIACN